VLREAPDVRETPTEGWYSRWAKKFLSAAGRMMGQTCNDIPGLI
jgi:hypothetical protein